MKDRCVVKFLSYGLVSLMLALTSCGGDGGGASVGNGRTPYARDEHAAGRIIPTLVAITISPINPLGINSGTQLQLVATGYYSDNSVQNVITLVTWTSSDTSIVTISNEPRSIGMATAVSKGYCSISATFEGLSVSTILGVN